MTAEPVISKLGESVKLVCSVTPAGNLTTEIMFMRGAGNNSKLCSQLIQFPDSCRVLDEVKNHYVPHCKYGNHSRTLEVRNYLFEILNMTRDDFTEWWCHSDGFPEVYTTIILRQYSK